MNFYFRIISFIIAFDYDIKIFCVPGMKTHLIPINWWLGHAFEGSNTDLTTFW